MTGEEMFDMAAREAELYVEVLNIIKSNPLGLDVYNKLKEQDYSDIVL